VGGDGGLACGNLGQSESVLGGLHAKRQRGPDRRGNTRDRDHELGTDSRTCVNVPHRWKAPRVVESVSSSRRDEGSGLGVQVDHLVRKREGEAWMRQGCQRSGSIGSARRNECRAPTRRSPPKRIRRRETPGSPVPWPRVQARWPRARRKPRRDAGSSRGAGARIQEVGSRSRSYASCFVTHSGAIGESRGQIAARTN